MQLLHALFADKTRVVTGLSLIGAVILLALINNFFLMWLVLGGVYLIAFHEASLLFNLNSHNSLYFYALMLWIVAFFYPYGDDLFVIVGLVFAAATAYNPQTSWKNVAPFIYPTAGMLFLLSLYKEYDITALIWLIVILASTDIGAYVVGKSMGKTKFCETSPNKTLEGVVGGVIIATLISFFIGIAIVDIEKAVIIPFITAVSSVFGDLFESYLKRQAGVKDSGSILPGHGGILDRIDGYLFGAIAMLVLLRGIV